MLVPLLIAATLGLCAVWALLRSSSISRLATAALAGFGIAHAACTGFGYDLGCSRWLRAANFDSAAAVAEHVRDDSLVFAQYPDPFYTLVELRSGSGSRCCSATDSTISGGSRAFTRVTGARSTASWRPGYGTSWRAATGSRVS